MRCPKCGYNSFDHLDNCKKCGKDLVEHKQKFGIVSVLFPGQMKPAEAAAEVESESVVEEAVAVAAATTATAAAGEVMAEDADATLEEPAAPEAAEGDDFGFDFMGDSEEEEDLSFDELFEEAQADEDVEETLPSPEQQAAEEEGDDFAFEPDAEEEATASELESDFGFDPAESAEDLEADDFELPPAEESAEKDEFSFDSDEVDFEKETEESEGAEEDPKDPFDLPESSQDEEAPEEPVDFFLAETESDSSELEEEDLSLADNLFAADPPQEDVLHETEPEEVESQKPLRDSFFEEEGSVPPAVEISSTYATEESVIAAGLPEEHISEQNSDESVVDDFAAPAVGLATAAAGAAVLATDGLSAEDETSIQETEEAKAAEAGIELLPQTGSRVVAFCCDLILLAIVGGCFVVAAEAAMSPAKDSLIPSLETLIDLSVPYFLVLFSLAFGYFTLFHFLAGQTPGKMLAGLRVETLEGEPLLFSQAFLRSVGGLLQVLPAGLGYVAILSSPERRGWNDRLAGTRLISLKGLSEEA